MTKGSTSQASCKLYDPLGWLSPITVHAMLLTQELWRKQVSWDEPLDNEFNGKWHQIAADIEEAAQTVTPLCPWISV